MSERWLLRTMSPTVTGTDWENAKSRQTHRQSSENSLRFMTFCLAWPFLLPSAGWYRLQKTFIPHPSSPLGFFPFSSFPPFLLPFLPIFYSETWKQHCNVSGIVSGNGISHLWLDYSRKIWDSLDRMEVTLKNNQELQCADSRESVILQQHPKTKR